MLKDIDYPSIEKIIEYNILALSLLKAKKADKAQVLSRAKIQDALDACMDKEGDLSLKAAVLLRELVQKHPFASGNRRTAFVVTKDFILSNGGSFKIQDEPAHADAMKGIREGYYSDEEIEEWITHGKIRKFERSTDTKDSSAGN